MLQTFMATLSPMATLFFSMAIGFTLNKLRVLPKDSGAVMSKLIVWVFYPALCFISMAKFCSVETISTHAINLLLATVGLALAISVSFILVGKFAKKGTYERGIYRYALTFANSGYMGDPLVLALFGDLMLSYYKIYTLPISLCIYGWGVGLLVPNKSSGISSYIKKMLNPPTVAMLLGMLVGFSGLGKYMPEFFINTLESLKSCMGPTAMLLAGFTVAEYSMVKMLKDKRTYFATALRTIIIPIVIIGALFSFKELLNHLFSLNIGNTVLYFTFFAVATPLGLNTVVFPKSYGEDAEPGAGMTLVSSVASIITIPLLYSLMTLLLGKP